MRHLRGLFAALLFFGIAATEPAPSDAAPEGQMTWGVHVSLAPTWFDPAETPGIGTPFMVLYALHDALVKPMPGNAMAPSLAESWSAVQGRPRLRVRAAPGREVPQRRPRHRRRREVLLRALPRRGGEGHEGQDGGGRGRRPAPRALPAQGAVARLHDLLREPGHRGRLDRARGSTWSRSATRASRRRRSAPAPTASSPSPRASSWCWRRTSSTGARPRA